VSFSALSSPFPTPPPLESRTAGAGAPPRRRGSPVAPPAHAARHPCVGLLVAAERPEVAEHPSSLRRPLPLAPCFAMAGTARPPRAAASRRRPWPWRRRGPPARSPLRRPAGALAPLARPDRGPARPRRWPAAAVGREPHRRRAWPWPRPWRACEAKQGSAPFCSLCSNDKWGPRVRGLGVGLFISLLFSAETL